MSPPHRSRFMSEDTEVEDARERVRVARAAYQEALASGGNQVRIELLKADLYEAEGRLVRIKRAKENAPPGNLL